MGKAMAIRHLPTVQNVGAASASQSGNTAWALGATQIISQSLSLAAANGSASAQLNLPATISLGAIYDYSSTLSLAAELSDTKWSCFKELRVKFSDPAQQPDSFAEETA